MVTLSQVQRAVTAQQEDTPGKAVQLSIYDARDWSLDVTMRGGPGWVRLPKDCMTARQRDAIARRLLRDAKVRYKRSRERLRKQLADAKARKAGRKNPISPTTTALIAVGVVAAGVTAAGIYEHFSAKPTATPVPTPGQGGLLKPGGLHGLQEGGAVTQPTTPATPTVNSTALWLSPGVITAPQVGSAGRTLTIHVPAGGGALTTSAIVDGVDQNTATGVQAVSVKTGRDSGTILVAYDDAQGAHKGLVTINYGTPPKTGTPQTVQFQGAGQTLKVSGAGVPGSLIVLAPPDAGTTMKSPYTIDGATVDFQEGRGANVSVVTTHWSGLISVQMPDAGGNVQTANVLYGP